MSSVSVFLRLGLAVSGLYLSAVSVVLATPVRSALVTAATSLTILPGTDTLCAGSSTSLLAAGCEDGVLLWETGDQTARIPISPVATRTYSVTCTSGTDQTVATTTVVVDPPLLIGSASQSICPGETLDLTDLITGYATLLQPEFRLGKPVGAVVDQPTRVTPTETGVYYLTAQNSSGCPGAATVSVTVATVPVASVASLSACADGSARATFDLLLLRTKITGENPNSEVSFFGDVARQEPLAIPSGYRSATGVVYAQVLDTQQTGCSATVPISLFAAVCGCLTGNCLTLSVRMVRLN